MRHGARSILPKLAAAFVLCTGLGLAAAPRTAEAAPLAVPAVEAPDSGVVSVRHGWHHRHHGWGHRRHGWHRGWHHRRHWHRPHRWHRHHHHHRRGFYRY